MRRRARKSSRGGVGLRHRCLLEALEGRQLLAGTGLSGVYYDNADFGGTRASRVDAGIDFSWAGSPVAGIGADTFAVNWYGSVEASFSQTYTFHLTSNDGARLWVNGKLLVDNWADHGTTTDTGTVALTAGQRVGIGIELTHNTGTATVKLEWSSASQAKQVVPGAALYPDLPQGPAVRVMPIGDSITEARGYYDNIAGYAGNRFWTYKQMQYGGYWPDMVGSMTGNFKGFSLYTNTDLDHEGHWGWRADEILAQIPTWAANAVPDVVLLHLGTNDLIQYQTPASTITEVGQIIDALRVANPNVKVLLAKLIPYTNEPNSGNIAVFNGLVPDLAASKTTVQSPVVVVDQNTGFSTASDTYDGIHPNASGEKKMADKWFAAIQALGLGDTIGPTIVSSRITSPTSIELKLSEPISAASAANIANYGLSGGQSVSAAVLGEDLRTITLTTTTLTVGGTYTLTVNGLADRAVAGNTIATNTQRSLVFDPMVFYRAINAAGIGVVLDGNQWEGSTAPNYTAAQLLSFYYPASLNPSTDLTRQSVVRTNVFNIGGVNFGMQNVPAGNYRVYFWTSEDDGNATYSISLEGQIVHPSYSSGAAGSWSRLGPFDVTVADGTLNLTTSGGSANLAGVEVYRLFDTAALTGTAGNDTYWVRTDPAGTQVRFWLNKNPDTDVPDLTLPNNAIGQVVLDALGGDDVLIIDRSTGGAIGQGDIDFRAGDGIDTIRVISQNANGTYVYAEQELIIDQVDVIRHPSHEKTQLDGGLWRFDGDLEGGDLIVNSATVDFSVSQHAGVLALNGTALATLLSHGSRVIRATSLNLGASATLDLTNNALIVQATAPTRDAVLADVVEWVSAARNNSLMWSGAGITSGAAAANPVFGLITLLNENAFGQPIVGNLLGEPVDLNSVLVRYGLNGDGDLNGVIDIDDYNRADVGYSLSRDGYNNGDINLDGQIDGDDYFLLDAAFLAQPGGMSGGEPEPLGAPVPEMQQVELPTTTPDDTDIFGSDGDEVLG